MTVLLFDLYLFVFHLKLSYISDEFCRDSYDTCMDYTLHTLQHIALTSNNQNNVGVVLINMLAWDAVDGVPVGPIKPKTMKLIFPASQPNGAFWSKSIVGLAISNVRTYSIDF